MPTKEKLVGYHSMQDMFERNVYVVAMIWAKSNQYQRPHSPGDELKALLDGWSLKGGDARHKGVELCRQKILLLARMES